HLDELGKGLPAISNSIACTHVDQTQSLLLQVPGNFQFDCLISHDLIPSCEQRSQTSCIEFNPTAPPTAPTVRPCRACHWASAQWTRQHECAPEPCRAASAYGNDGALARPEHRAP